MTSPLSPVTNTGCRLSLSVDVNVTVLLADVLQGHVLYHRRNLIILFVLYLSVRSGIMNCRSRQQI